MSCRCLKWVTIVVVIAIIIAGGAYFLMRNNIHAVVPHKVYRSAQLSPQSLIALVKAKKIKSIINLRGKNPNKSWYRKEMRATAQLGIKHYDIPMHAFQLPSVKQLRQLVTLIQTAPRPVLIHCASGADRTGLASAIVLILKNKPFIVARDQVSLWYFAYKDDSVGKLVLPYYRRWLTAHHLKSSKVHFLSWLKQVQFKPAQ